MFDVGNYVISIKTCIYILSWRHQNAYTLFRYEKVWINTKYVI